MVPNGWKQVRPSDIISIFNGFAFKSSDATNSGTKWLKIANVGIGKIKWDTQTFLPESYANEYNKFLLKKEDIVVALTRPTLDNKLKVARITTDEDVSLLNQRVGRIDCNNECDSNFIFQILQSREFAHRINIGLLGTDPPNLSKKIFEDFQILLPPLPEQQKIAKILTTWDKAIDTTERLIDNSKQLKKALMQQLLTGKKRLLDESGKRFEGEWEEVQLGELAFIDKKSLGKSTPDDFEFKYISLSDVSEGVISNSTETYVYESAPSRARRLISENDVLLSTVRPNLKGFAKAKAEHDGFVASTGFSVITAKKQASSDYIYHYVFGEHITRQIYALVVGSNYPAINSSEVSKLKILKPSLEEQQKIAAVLTNADKEIELLEQQLADLQQEKKALMQQLLTGKKRVKVD